MISRLRFYVGNYVAIGTILLAPIAIWLPIAPAVLAQTNALPKAVVNGVKQDIVKRFKIPLASLIVQDSSVQSWPDGCLGLAKPGEVCTAAIVNGWQVIMTDGSQNYVYRTDNTGKNLRLETEPQSILPLTVARKLRQFAAADLGVTLSKLRVSTIKPRIFDGCLGIFNPNQACTKIAIPGWQAVLTNGRRSWVYHLNQSATRIVQNTVASNAVSPVEISFSSIDAALAPNILFSSSVSGDITGRTIINTLTTDGKVTRLVTAPNIRSRPVQLRTLTPAQIDRFKALLAQQGSPNLDGVSYLTSASVADVPTVTFSERRAMVSYTSIEQQRVPKSLQVIITAWEKISR
jgi:hypothetical protein